MYKILKTEFMKLKRYSVVWIGVATTAAVVGMSWFIIWGDSTAEYTFPQYAGNVIWNNFSLMFPAAITLIAGYIIERERTDDTLKNLLALPVSFRSLLACKLILVALLAVFFAVLQFGLTLLTLLAGALPGLTPAAALLALGQMIGMNLCVYIAVLPIIILTAQRPGSYMAGVGFAFFYGVAGVFASGHGLTGVYPIAAGLNLIHHPDVQPTPRDVLTSGITLLVMLALSLVLLASAQNREPAGKSARKTVGKTKKRRA